MAKRKKQEKKGSGKARSPSGRAKGVTQSSEWRDLAEFLGLDPDMDEDEASEATYFACLKVLSESVAKMPCKLMRRTDGQGVIVERDSPLYAAVESRPNRFMNATVFWSAVEQNRNQHGNAYVLVDRKRERISLWLLPSEQVQVWYDNALKISDQPEVWYIWNPPDGERVALRSGEVMHLRTSDTLDGIMGVSVADQLSATIKANVKGQKMLNRLYDSDMASKAVVQYTGDLSEANTKKFMKGLERYIDGKEETRHLIPIPPGTTLTPLTMKLTDSQFVDLRKYTAIQIASAFGVRPYQVGDYDKTSYASQSAQQLAFYVDTLLYIVRQYEQELTNKVLTRDERSKGLFYKFNVASILRADQATQIHTLAEAVTSGIYTPDEARAYLDLGTKPGGDELLVNGSTIPARLAGRQYERTPDEGGEEGEQAHG